MEGWNMCNGRRYMHSERWTNPRICQVGNGLCIRNEPYQPSDGIFALLKRMLIWLLSPHPYPVLWSQFSVYNTCSGLNSQRIPLGHGPNDSDWKSGGHGPGECWTCGSWVGQKQRFEARNCSIIVKNNEPYQNRTPDAAQRDRLRGMASTFRMTHRIVGSGVALSLAMRARGGGPRCRDSEGLQNAPAAHYCWDPGSSRVLPVDGSPSSLGVQRIQFNLNQSTYDKVEFPPVLPPQSSWVKYFGDWGKQHMRGQLWPVIYCYSWPAVKHRKNSKLGPDLCPRLLRKNRKIPCPPDNKAP
ncbi:hypothetical protein B0H10DRAFT_1961878 [Mycena sp. CBHHK59/15]|nr:hypothetical protein B0H10DRAFT_1961878 [Mycena sp. CBHHK59/15]